MYNVLPKDELFEIVISNYEEIQNLTVNLKKQRDIIAADTSGMFHSDIDEHLYNIIRRNIVMFLAKKTAIASDIIYEYVQDKFNDSILKEI